MKSRFDPTRPGLVFLGIALVPSLWLLFSAPVAAQSYGQNQVVKRDFQWSIRSTEHFDIYYYKESERLVPEAAEILERSYQKISKELDAGFVQRRPFFLYASVDDMEQSNIVSVGDGTGGVTESFKDRFMVYNDGTKEWLDDVVTHELTHVFQYSILVSGFWKSVRILKSFVYPLWMMEGGAEFSTGSLDETTEEVYVRDAAVSNGLIPLWKMEHFSHLKPHQITLAYKSGATVMRFLYKEYGADKVGKMFKLFEARFEVNSVLQDLLGMDIFTFDRKWREYEEEKYRRVVRLENLREPYIFGNQLTQPSSSNIPEFNTSPVFTPDGRRMAFLSTREGYPPELVIRDLKAGKNKRLVAQAYARVENIMLGNFTAISRVLAISPDGKTLAFAGQKNHVDSIYLYDLDRGKLRRVRLEGFEGIMEPSFSPDGKKIAFSGMKDGTTDIYLLDMASRKVTALTSDPQDDQSPSFSPDGKSVVFSSEIETSDEGMRYQRRLYRVNLADLSMERLEDVRGAARDPVYSADGGKILFAMDNAGFNEIYELDLASRRVTRLTRSIGGSYTPVYTPEGDIAFASFRHGSIHIFRGARSRFLSEEAPADPPELPGIAARPAGAASVSSGTWTAAEVSSGTAALSPPRPYRFNASTDLFLPAFFYSSQGGFFWTSYWQGSDMLGNHQAAAQVSYNSGAGYLNYQTNYVYGRYRPQIFAGFQGLTANSLIDLSNGLSNNVVNHSQFVGVRYPFDRYHRMELAALTQEFRQEYPDIQSVASLQTRALSAAFIRDTVNGRYLVATRGSRLRVFYDKAADVLGGNVSAYTYGGEAIHYLDTGGQSALVLRSAAADSWGPNSEQYGLGGLNGVRGYGSSTVDNVGSRFALATAEWRFPIVKNLDYYMWYFFPDFYFKAIFGTVFTDAGYAWDAVPDVSRAQWNVVRNSVGLGVRIHTFILQLFPFVIQMDYAHRTTSNGGVFYVYLGPLF